MTNAPERILVGVSQRGDLLIDSRGGTLNGLEMVAFVRAGLHAATLARAERAEDALAEAQFERDNNRAKLEVKKRELFDAVAAKERAEALLKEAVEALSLIIAAHDDNTHDLVTTFHSIQASRATLARIQEAKP